MTRKQGVVGLSVLAIGYFFTAGAVVWLWGPYGLLGSGLAALIAGFFIEGS